MRKRHLLFIAVLTAMMLVLAACGNSDNKDASEPTDNSGSDQTVQDEGTSTTLDVTATNFKYNKDTFTIPANKEVTINFNSEEGQHGFQIKGTDVNIQGKGTAKVTLEAGEYEIHCSIPCGSGHANMKATLIVK